MNESYEITMQTPVGKKTGTIRLVSDGGVLSGYIKAMGYLSSFKNGVIEGDAIAFSGILNAGFLQISYKAKGRIDGKNLTADAYTKWGTFKILGTQIE